MRRRTERPARTSLQLSIVRFAGLVEFSAFMTGSPHGPPQDQDAFAENLWVLDVAGSRGCRVPLSVRRDVNIDRKHHFAQNIVCRGSTASTDEDECPSRTTDVEETPRLKIQSCSGCSRQQPKNRRGMNHQA